MPDLWTFVAVGWLVEAFVIGFVMGRRGFDPFAWTLMATIMGPIIVPAAAFSYWRLPKGAGPRLIHIGRIRRGTLRVLVGVDGSAESQRAVDETGRLFGVAAGSVTIARVVAIDATPEAERDAEAELQSALAAHPGLEASTVLLRGEPVHALREFARLHEFDVLVIGTRGAGFSKALMGSVATGLARSAVVPVLLVGSDAEKASLKEAV